MSNIEDQFNLDVTAIMDDAFGTVWKSEDGTDFTAQFTLFRSESFDNMSGNSSQLVAELRWQTTNFNAPIPEHRFTHPDGSYWVMDREPEIDGGEVIASISCVKRSRTGAM